MYHRYFGLQEEPFSIAVNPRYLFMSARHRDALAHLLYGVGAGGGFILLTGEVGTGKTTINRALMQQLPPETDVALILNPALNADELLATVCDEFKIDYQRENYTLKSLTDKLHAFLLENHARGRNTVLLIDEAQHLQFDVLEQIRLLTNLETNTRKLLQIILVGQPELSEMLSRPELRQLNQRITARYELQPLSREETDAYIRHRLQVAGLPASQEIFPAGVVREIHRLTDGIPRVINVLCDRVLLGAYGHNHSRADMKTLRQAAAEVFGSTQSGATVERQNLGLVAALLAGVAIAAGVYWQWGGARYSTAVLPEPLPTARQALPAPVPIAVQPTVTPDEKSLPEVIPADIEPTVAGEGPATTAFVAEPVPETLNPAPLPDSTELAAPSFYGDRWRALGRLSEYLTGRLLGDCTALADAGQRCEEMRDATWDELFTYNLPVVLSLITPERFTRYGVLVGVSGNQAALDYEGEEYLLSLEELGALWQGDFMFIWEPPPGYFAPFGRGASGPAVSWLAMAFAELDAQDEPLSGEVFNEALDQRVRMFQRQVQLGDDGMVGMKTLLKLSEQRGLGAALLRPQAAALNAGSH